MIDFDDDYFEEILPFSNKEELTKLCKVASSEELEMYYDICLTEDLREFAKIIKQYVKIK
jgi:hypothetical protein